ncbi:MAG: hypothetical protein JXA60_00865 [Candidatus Coatesbacteria bacterium]|nr:hypothetical protein [Candidatus Coatesbacteria bacterium]
MKQMIALITLLSLVSAVSLFAFDPMYDNFEVIMYKKNTIRFNAYLDYAMASAAFDSSGTKTDYSNDGKSSCIRIPVGITYSVSPAIEAGLIAQFVSKSMEMTVNNTTTDYSGSGIGDTWLFAKFMLMPDPTVNVRVAGKLPTGPWHDYYEGTAANDELPVGDGQIDLELGLNGRFPITAGRGSDPRDDDVIAAEYSLGFRYRLNRSYSYEIAGTTTDVEETPGNQLLYSLGPKILISPGKFWGFLRLAGYFGIGDPETKTTTNGTSNTVKGDPSSIMYIQPGFEFKAGVGFYVNGFLQYPIMGKYHEADMNILFGGIGMKFGH